ncbi:unnamed protein product [Urochloa humidicola]
MHSVGNIFTSQSPISQLGPSKDNGDYEEFEFSSLLNFDKVLALDGEAQIDYLLKQTVTTSGQYVQMLRQLSKETAMDPLDGIICLLSFQEVQILGSIAKLMELNSLDRILDLVSDSQHQQSMKCIIRGKYLSGLHK